MLPRHDLVDDRTVAAGRRNYLSPADVRGLPIGVWVEAGPYTRGEWLARGVAGAVGVAAFLRVNGRSYLAAYETRTGAMWRLETSGRGAHLGLVAEGSVETLAEAKDGARAALQERFPEVARAVEPAGASSVIGPQHGWVAIEGGRDARSQRRVLDERVSAMVSPGPGGRWQTWATVDGSPRQGPLVADIDAARVAAEGVARGALMELASYAPDRANRIVHDLATSAGPWDRTPLVQIVGHRLTDVDRGELADTREAGRLVELMRSTGVLAPETMTRVLRAEDFGAATVTALVPALGLPIPDAVRLLHDEWRVDRLDVGSALGATADELRAAGCTAAEMLAAAPREELRRLDTRESTWELVGPTLLEAGYTAGEAVAHLAAHAPTPATFAVGVTSIVDEPIAAFVYARTHAGPDDLAALGERYELAPTDTARVLLHAAYPTGRAIDVMTIRCDGDQSLAAGLVSEAYGRGTGRVAESGVGVEQLPEVEMCADAVGVGVEL